MKYGFQLLSLTSSFLILNASLFAQTNEASEAESSTAEDRSTSPLSFDPPEGKGNPVFLYGSAATDDTGEPIPPPEEWPDTDDRVEFDFAHLSSGGRVLYVSSNNTEKTFQMVDGDVDTFYDFAEPANAAFFVVSLAEVYPIYKASISTTKPIKSVELWAFNKDPKEFFSSESGSSGDPSEVLSRRAPVGQITVSEDEELTSLVLSLPDTTARYILVRVALKDAGDPIQVSLFSVIGDVPREYLGARDLRQWYESDQSLPDAPQIPVASP